MGEASKATDLTGVWDGTYWYGGGQNPTRFVATLFETAGSVHGTTLELAPPGFVATGELPANILGTRNGAEVSLVKAYEVKTRMRLAPIAYTGVVDASFSVIEGGWRIPGPQPLAGGFIMRRISSPDVMAEASAAAAARAPRRKFVSVEVKKKRARKTPIKVD
jgi:hypothetical protein